MRASQYADPPMWTVLVTLDAAPRQTDRMSHLAASVLTGTGYPGAYRAIGRLIAAGYAQYAGTASASDRNAVTWVSLTDRGRRRVLAGRDWAACEAARWKAAAARCGAAAQGDSMPAAW